jgi:hypothetical protein
MAAGVVSSGAVVFIVFGDTLVQPWNDPTSMVAAASRDVEKKPDLGVVVNSRKHCASFSSQE